LQTLDQAQREQLLERARTAGLAAEDARQRMLEHAAARQDALLELYDGGSSVRDLAHALDVSAAVVQSALTAARGRRGSVG
jgi:DNA-directed RNA polymerase specialized sigma24 family protein